MGSNPALKQRIPPGYNLINLNKTEFILGKERKCLQPVAIKPAPPVIYKDYVEYEQAENEFTEYALNNIHEVNVEVTEIDNFIIMKNGK
jgi:hypothetical protein